MRRLTYAYDPAGRRAALAESGGVRTTWSYDASGQVTRERRSGLQGFDATFTYDPAGNRLAEERSGLRHTSVYDAANQLLSTRVNGSRTTYQYDPNGNRERKESLAGTTYYAWDFRNRLSAAEPPAGPVTLAYDPADRRTSKQSPGREVKAEQELGAEPTWPTPYGYAVKRRAR